MENHAGLNSGVFLTSLSSSITPRQGHPLTQPHQCRRLPRRCAEPGLRWLLESPALGSQAPGHGDGENNRSGILCLNSLSFILASSWAFLEALRIDKR